ncbi:MAG: hypothetical protein V2I97_17155 [Desulfococcaceae bacterium]|jgi:DnaJ-domain-containing protein 1|nr:hypothetical protein [Desulfococcaceae bacterium]
MKTGDWTDEESKMYFLALSLIALSDQVLADEELKFLEQVREAMGIDRAEAERILAMAKDEPSCVKLLESVRPETLRRTIFRDCVIMAFADRIFHPLERLMLESVRMNLGISEELADRFTQWAQEGQAWQDKGEQLIHEGAES